MSVTAPAQAIAVVLSLLAVVLCAGVWLRRRRVAQYLGTSVVPVLPLWRVGAPALAMVCIAVALLARRHSAGAPRGGAAANVVLVLDASNSMYVRDVKPDRMTAARQLARALLTRLNGRRVALVAFAGRAYLLAPLTTDVGAIELYLARISPTAVPQVGSSLAEAIRAANRALPDGGEGAARGAVVLVSDGDALEDPAEVMRAARELARSGATLDAIGVGTQAGGPVPDRDLVTGRTLGYKRDLDGTVARSPLRAELLRELARIGGGVYAPGTPAGAARVAASLTGRASAGAPAALVARSLSPEIGAVFTSLALLLLLAEVCVPPRRKQWRERSW